MHCVTLGRKSWCVGTLAMPKSSQLPRGTALPISSSFAGTKGPTFASTSPSQAPCHWIHIHSNSIEPGDISKMRRKTKYPSNSTNVKPWTGGTTQHHIPRGEGWEVPQKHYYLKS